MQFSLSSFPIPTFRQNRGKEIFGLPLLSLISLRKSVNHLVYVLSQLMLIFRDQDARLERCLTDTYYAPISNNSNRRYSNRVYTVHMSGDVYRSYLQIPLAHHARALRQTGVRMRLDEVLDAEGRRVVESAAAARAAAFFLGGEDRSRLRCSGY